MKFAVRDMQIEIKIGDRDKICNTDKIADSDRIADTDGICGYR